MDIRVSGHQIDTGAALQAQVHDRLSEMVDKYFSRAMSSHVTFGRQPGGAFSCDIITHVTQGLILKGSGTAHDVHLAFDQATGKIEKQLRRYKTRLKARSERVLSPREEEEAAYRIFAAEQQDESPDDAPEAPPVIAETRVDIPECSVADAVMMLDLRNTNALFFKNAGTGRHNMVYRRDDHSVGWVEPR
ncbi:ribosome-associated translation inhibitor RaiA [Erythrobacteraceae bacterium CFH 75059]|uniref:ribosome hibernation-promoting factor, HPF/YfiA family n=1 Tax=Qipengyuania thermophila TaxID=2509361 RepID=UPI001020A6EA|nr:ribosome-associated translation inhibitor RaiA [Qipengyuania thermophila]TCD06685.1 ribosome-associated translation inhibitor RaiA [Erythrobacteraceae bacterium CFH 75059]